VVDLFASCTVTVSVKVPGIARVWLPVTVNEPVRSGDRSDDVFHVAQLTVAV